MQIEKLEDILTINMDKLKSPEKTRLLTKIKQLIKADNKSEAKEEEAAVDYPYEAISIVGEKLITLKFDLDTKKARVVNTETDTRDIKGRNYMSGADAVKRLTKLVKTQKEIVNEEN